MPCIVYIETIMIDRQDRAHPIGIRVAADETMERDKREECFLSL